MHNNRSLIKMSGRTILQRAGTMSKRFPSPQQRDPCQLTPATPPFLRNSVIQPILDPHWDQGFPTHLPNLSKLALPILSLLSGAMQTMFPSDAAIAFQAQIALNPILANIRTTTVKAPTTSDGSSSNYAEK